MKLLSVIIGVLATVWLASSLQAEDPALGGDPSKTREFQLALREYQDWKIVKVSVQEWLNAGSSGAKVRCDEALNRLRSFPDRSIGVDFCAAKVAWMNEEPDRAIEILTGVVASRANEKAPGVNLKVGVAARLWIGMIARCQGRQALAKRMYREVLSIDSETRKKPILDQVCHLYLSEISGREAPAAQIALASLDQVGQLQSPTNRNEAMLFGLYQNLARHRSGVVKTGVETARSQIEDSNEKGKLGEIMIQHHLLLTGVIAEPTLTFNEIPGVRERCLEMAASCHASPLDRSFALSALGDLHLRRRDFVRAEECFRKVFEADAFFAPEAGLKLAKSQKLRGAQSDADETLNEVVKRHRSYAFKVHVTRRQQQ